MAVFIQSLLTPQQYLELERAAETRSEFYDGVMYGTAGTSLEHSIIAGNLFAAMHSALRGSPCMSASSDLRVRLDKRTYVYPDIVVVCEQPKFGDDSVDTLLNPTLVIEVLSPSTERHDRGFKWARYRTLESLQTYVLVSQAEARVEVYKRQADGAWLLSEAVGVDSTIVLGVLGGKTVRVALADVYERVQLPEEPELPV
jgi:Uma2 family endonuclease